MKKILLAMGIAGIILSGCGSDEVTNEEPKKEESNQEEVSKTSAEKVTIEEPTTTATFENGTFETEKYSLTISKAEVIQSPMEQKPGLYVTFKLTNKMEDEDIIPNNVLFDLHVTQENETSRIDLLNNYHFLDAFGDDTESYNKQVDLSNASANALLPGKTVEFVNAYTLDNDSHNVVFSGIDVMTLEEVGEHVVELK